jgi:hypothetical protein
MTDEWVEYDDGEVIITEDAPDRVWELIENESEYTRAMLNFHIACEAIGYDTFERVPEPHEWRDLRDKHMGQMKEAVRDGDIETAQEELKYAELIAKSGRRVSEALKEKVPNE